MKRPGAFHKLRTICHRLDEADPQQFFVIWLRLSLFGSLPTDKPIPGDIDLLFECRQRPDLASQPTADRSGNRIPFVFSH
jgi:hypothetical protein